MESVKGGKSGAEPYLRLEKLNWSDLEEANVLCWLVTVRRLDATNANDASKSRSGPFRRSL